MSDELDAPNRGQSRPLSDEGRDEKLSELAILQQSVEEQKSKTADYYDQLLRLKAEFDNYRKRVEKEKVEARSWGKQDVIMPLLSLVDVFEQAMAQVQNAKDVKQVTVGLEFLHKNFSSFLKSEGLVPVEIIGKTFDPHLAEAVEQVEVDNGQIGQVLAEIQKGYSFQGRVIRPARVRVGVAKNLTPSPLMGEGRDGGVRE
jgi:molecular chaperone GrpE